ncbi:MAG: polysaccharide pyruvyl transferase family protein [Bacteroidales bacterium]|nr:polysaccharide pyruvyl transferase family protein [Bacteroidales bacterium]
MNINKKLIQLRSIINTQLASLIDSDYAYFDYPCYPNIGDNLIWEGTRTFLKQFNHNCIYRAAIETFHYCKLPSHCIIILQGGGSFGDLWARHQIFRKKIIDLYPNNPTIIFPQSVCYENRDNLVQDEVFFAKHTNVIICARDQVSYDFLRIHFPHNKSLLVPDMAFFVNIDKFKPFIKSTTNKVLYAKRNDPELAQINQDDDILHNADIHDWPTMEKTSFADKIIGYVEGCIYYISRINFFQSFDKLRDLLRDKYHRNHLIRVGIKFLSKYKIVYSTRLHIMVLSAMLEKKVFLLDNSYGKNVNLYNTWLKDVDNIELL